jgi:hypothetical protein
MTTSNLLDGERAEKGTFCFFTGWFNLQAAFRLKKQYVPFSTAAP